MYLVKSLLKTLICCLEKKKQINWYILIHSNIQQEKRMLLTRNSFRAVHAPARECMRASQERFITYQ